MSGFKEGLSQAFRDAVIDTRERFNERIDDEVYEAQEYEFEKGVERAILSMLELKISEEDIISKLIDHWDLRKSESKRIIAKIKRDHGLTE